MKALVLCLLLCVIFMALCSVEAGSRSRRPVKTTRSRTSTYKRKKFGSGTKKLVKSLKKLKEAVKPKAQKWGEGVYNRNVGGNVKQTWRQTRKGTGPNGRRLISTSRSAKITFSFHASRSEYTMVNIRIPLNASNPESFACLEGMVNLSPADAVRAARTSVKELPNKNYDLIERPCKKECKCERNFYLKVADADAAFVPGASVTSLKSVLRLGKFPAPQECTYNCKSTLLNEWLKNQAIKRWNRLVSSGYCAIRDL